MYIQGETLINLSYLILSYLTESPQNLHKSEQTFFSKEFKIGALHVS